ncbi:MAG TPA: hemerythrin domain-containing protein [Sphingobium sp.]|nr:hemerythrin domain-containing protein [Sphingobium sp.]
MDLQQLQGQHDALEVLADRFLKLVDDDRTLRPLGALRWQFARELMAHLALEDQIFYPAMQRQSHVPLQEAAARLQIEMGPIALSFSHYMSRWSDDRITREWSEFCRESRYMVESILNRMRKEERLLMPLLAEAGLELLP